MRVPDGSLQMQRMKDTVNGPLMRTHAITGKTRLVVIAAVAGVLLLMPRLTAAAPWFLPDSDDKILAEAASLIEQGRLQDVCDCSIWMAASTVCPLRAPRALTGIICVHTCSGSRGTA